MTLRDFARKAFDELNAALCSEGDAAKLTKVEVSDSDRSLHQSVMQEVVLIEWAKRAGKEYAQEWNDTVGKVVGLTIPVDKL